MEAQNQGNESNAQVRIDNIDGSTHFNARRTVRDVTNDGEVKHGVATVRGETFAVRMSANGDGWKWIGRTY